MTREKFIKALEKRGFVRYPLNGITYSLKKLVGGSTICVSDTIDGTVYVSVPFVCLFKNVAQSKALPLIDALIGVLSVDASKEKDSTNE